MKIPKTITDWVLRSPVCNMHINEFEFDFYLSQNDSCLFGNDMAIREKYISMFPKKHLLLCMQNPHCLAALLLKWRPWGWRDGSVFKITDWLSLWICVQCPEVMQWIILICNSRSVGPSILLSWMGSGHPWGVHIYTQTKHLYNKIK